MSPVALIGLLPPLAYVKLGALRSWTLVPAFAKLTRYGLIVGTLSEAFSDGVQAQARLCCVACALPVLSRKANSSCGRVH